MLQRAITRFENVSKGERDSSVFKIELTETEVKKLASELGARGLGHFQSLKEEKSGLTCLSLLGSCCTNCVV